MTAEPMLTAGPTTARPIVDAGPAGPEPGRGAVIRQVFELVEPKSDAVGRQFYATLFSIAPETRELFPVVMEVQRGRLLRALVHVMQKIDEPDELVPFAEQLGRDHRKFGVLAEHYTALGRALRIAVGSHAGRAWTPEVEKVWTETYEFVAATMRSAAEREVGPASWFGRVVGHERIGWDVARITVQTSEPVPYRPGQYVSVETPQRPRLWRYLSPAGLPQTDGTLQFHVRAVEGGWVSRAVVAHSRVGDTWRIGPPMGRMQIDPASEQDLLMIAGGTGVAPLRAMLLDLAIREEQPRTTMFVGGRTWDDLYEIDALRKLSYANPWLDVVPVVEEGDEESGARLGTLAEVVTAEGAWADHDVLVCGSPSMIRSTVSRMLVAGTPLDRISYDPFTVD